MAKKRYLHTSDEERAKDTVPIGGARKPVRELLDYDIQLTDVPCMGPNGREPLFVLDASTSNFFYPLTRMFETLGFFGEGVYEVMVHFVEDEKTSKRYVEDRLAKDPNMYVAYDQTGMFDDKSCYPSSTFACTGSTFRSCEYRGGIDMIEPARLSVIADAAVKSAAENYAQAFGFKDDRSDESCYGNVKSTIEAYGLGYVRFALDEEQFDSVVESRVPESNASAESVMISLGDVMPRYGEWLELNRLREDTLKVIRVWNYALRVSGTPFNVLGYRFNESEIYDRRVDTELTARVAEMTGVASMLESVFSGGVPIEDILA